MYKKLKIIATIALFWLVIAPAIVSAQEWTTDIRSSFIIAREPTAYVTPDNEIVKSYASQLFIDTDGRIRYKETLIPWLEDSKGNVLLWINKPFLNNYTFNVYPNPNKNNIPWLIPEDYLNNGQQGVCSAWALTVTSLMLSGNMSVQQGNEYVQIVIPAKVVIGYTENGVRDAWVEYRAYNKTLFTSTGLVSSGFYGEDKASYTQFSELKDVNVRPVFEFTDKYFGEYYEN